MRACPARNWEEVGKCEILCHSGAMDATAPSESSNIPVARVPVATRLAPVPCPVSIVVFQGHVSL